MSEQVYPIEEYVEHADELAQEVVNFWGMTVKDGDGATLAEDFMAVFEKACEYRNAKKIADNHRRANILTEPVEAEVGATGLSFAQRIKIFKESKQ
jgi:hypothetical protein